jgi:hypothetical protein
MSACMQLIINLISLGHNVRSQFERDSYGTYLGIAFMHARRELRFQPPGSGVFTFSHSATGVEYPERGTCDHE